MPNTSEQKTLLTVEYGKWKGQNLLSPRLGLAVMSHSLIRTVDNI